MRSFLTMLFMFAFAAPVLSAGEPEISVTGGKIDQTNVVCSVPLPTGTTGITALKLPDGNVIPAQIVGPDILAEKEDRSRRLYFILPAIEAGKTIKLVPTAVSRQTPAEFHFVDDKGNHSDLLLGSRPVLRYINAPHDPAAHFSTMKPFHQVFDPAEGKTLLTSGTHPTAKDGLFPHHRGLFFGFNKVTYTPNKTADIWHGTDNVFSQQEKVLEREAGPVLGREADLISWHGKDGAAFADEQREVTVYAVQGGTMIDWSTLVSTKLTQVRLDGDPQHAGFHFRASQEVARKIQAEQALAKKDKRPAKPADTYFLRPDGKGKPGETRNWDPKGADPRTINLPWNAMSFTIGDKRYTVLRVNHPGNPKETRGSERDYGRFGDYFEYTVTPEMPLRLRYRVWIQEGEMTVEQCKALSAAFTDPPRAAIK
jgi:hypothetical protein